MKPNKLQSLYTRSGTSTVNAAPDHDESNGNIEAATNGDNKDRQRRFPEPSIFQRAQLRGFLHRPSDAIFLIQVVFSAIWALVRLHYIELPYHLITRFKNSSKQHPAAWSWWTSVYFAAMRAGAIPVCTMGQARFVGLTIDHLLPLQLMFVSKIKVTKDVKFKVKLDVLLRPERATLFEVRENLRTSGFTDDILHPSQEYLESMHPQGLNAPLANLPEEVGDIDSDGTYTLTGEWIEALDEDQVHASNGSTKPRSKTVILYFHGGAHVFGSARSHAHFLAKLAKDVGPGTRVFALNYRLAPEHPFPAAIHDAFAAYLYLTEPDHAALILDECSAANELAVDPRDIVVAGDSAGGNLAAAFMLYMTNYVQPSTEPRFVLPHASLLLSQTATHDRQVDESRLYAHRLGLENPGQVTRIEVYKDMVHVHQVLLLLFKSSRIATKNLARFIERSEHLRDEHDVKVANTLDDNGNKRSYAAMLRKVPMRNDSKPNEAVGGDGYMPAYKMPTMVREKAVGDGVEWVIVEQDGRENAGDEAFVPGPYSHQGLSIEAVPASRPSSESIPTTPSGAVLKPLTRLTPKHDSTFHQLPSNAIHKRSIPITSTASVIPIDRVGYARHILIGTPPQRLAVLFDTGSDLALVISDKCQGLECPDLTHFSCSISTACVDFGAEEGGSSKDSTGDGEVNSVISVKKASHHVATKDLAEDSHTSPKAGSKEPIAGASSLTTSPTPDINSKLQAIQKMKSAAKSPPSAGSAKERGKDSIIFHLVKRLIGPVGVMKIEDNLRKLEDSDSNVNSIIGNSIKSPTPAPVPAPPGAEVPWSHFYNQSYVDGSWGAGVFVQDRIQIDTTPAGEVFNSYSHLHELDSDETESPSTIEQSAVVTFLDVVQDNLGLIRGYDGQISGLLGLSRASPTGRKTFLQELVEQGSLPQPVILMHLEIEGATFLLGGIDHSKYTGELIYSPVTDPIIWQISLQGLGTRVRDPVSVPSSLSGLGADIHLGASRSSPNGGSKMIPQMDNFRDAALILDSGTSSILIPTGASQVIHAGLNGTWDLIHRTWFLPCTGPDLVWWISLNHAVVQSCLPVRRQSMPKPYL
ncbi:hypothetical protein BGX27_011140 [Mortierella sp. AM989]|nr:hypothetical protein BGX27_011140 [Mortierella sp. AM989]